MGVGSIPAEEMYVVCSEVYGIFGVTELKIHKDLLFHNLLTLLRFFTPLRSVQNDSSVNFETASSNNKEEILHSTPNDKVRNCKGMNPLKFQFIFIFNDPRH
jgi:hypothetical protein